MTYDYKIPEHVTAFRQLRADVEQCVREGINLQATLAKLADTVCPWETRETEKFIGGFHWEASQKIQEAARAAKVAAVEPPPATPTPTPAKPRTALRSQTRQAKKAKFSPADKSALEKRYIPEYPGCRIDSNHHVFKPDGTEATYSFNKKFRTCARIKHESGKWKEPSIIELMELVGFRETYRARKERQATAYNDRAEAHAEDPEAFPDPNCTRKCCISHRLQ
jgi:hypothetical protein